MMRALYTAATGMLAQQYNIDTISNNLANVSTAGFRKNNATFQDLIYQVLQAPGAPIGPSVVPTGNSVGLGVKIGSSVKQFTQGTLQQTDNPLNIAIEGNGFFQVTLPDGTVAYTRDGTFTQDSNGAIVTSNGYFLNPQISIPSNAVSVQVQQDGTVDAQIPGQTNQTQIGQITLANFVNPAGLQAVGQNLFVQTNASGAPIVSTPGVNGAGIVQGGYLENSNVAIVSEIVNMIVAQRAYEASSKAVSTSDQMLQTAIAIKQG